MGRACHKSGKNTSNGAKRVASKGIAERSAFREGAREDGKAEASEAWGELAIRAATVRVTERSVLRVRGEQTVQLQ